ELEPERDLVRAVRDPQPDARLGRLAPPRPERRVLDEHADVRVAVEARQVEADLLVDAGAGGVTTPRRVRQQIRHRDPLRSSGRGRGVKIGWRPGFRAEVLCLPCSGEITDPPRPAVGDLLRSWCDGRTALPLSYRSTECSGQDSNLRPVD